MKNISGNDLSYEVYKIMERIEKIANGQTFLGIELGSTRIKAVLTDDDYVPIASGAADWENRFENGFWTYSLDDIHGGLKKCFSSLAADVKEKYGVYLTSVKAMGISAMMHGYMAFDENGKLLTPFRTWRCTSTGQASSELTELLKFNIPQRWSISHLYQAILNREEHIPHIAYISTLAGYIHYLLTGKRIVGVGEASGIFPVSGKDYDAEMLSKTEDLFRKHGFERSLKEILPAVADAGEKGSFLTESGAKFLDGSGRFKAGIPVCPPEGDAGTGMTATNSVRPGTGNVSAGTSIFAMPVLERPLSGVYPEIDVVTTPDGAPVAMVHCNNCCSEIDVWVKMFGEFAELSGYPIEKTKLYELLYTNAMKGDPDCGGITAYNFLSGEPVAGVDEGRPMYFRTPDSGPDLANFFRAQLYSTVSALKTGMDILFEKEKISLKNITAHGGLFKVKNAAQQVLADALGTEVSVMETAGEGGAWGIALLAAYMTDGEGSSLADWLDSSVFADSKKITLAPDENGSKGFAEFMTRYKAGLNAEKSLKGVE